VKVLVKEKIADTGMFPAVETADVEALTACIDWVIENDEAVTG
jgi:hypothetical protein